MLFKLGEMPDESEIPEFSHGKCVLETKTFIESIQQVKDVTWDNIVNDAVKTLDAPRRKAGTGKSSKSQLDDLVDIIVMDDASSASEGDADMDTGR